VKRGTAVHDDEDTTTQGGAAAAEHEEPMIVTIAAAHPIGPGLTLVTYAVQDRIMATTIGGEPLIGGRSRDGTFHGQAIVGPDGAGLIGHRPNTGTEASVSAAVFAAEHERRSSSSDADDDLIDGTEVTE
jgi:hypothetical protein